MLRTNQYLSSERNRTHAVYFAAPCISDDSNGMMCWLENNFYIMAIIINNYRHHLKEIRSLRPIYVILRQELSRESK